MMAALTSPGRLSNEGCRRIVGPQYQSGQPKPGTNATLARKLESTCCGGDVLNAGARAVEDRDLVRPRPAAAAADDNIPEFGVSGVRRNQSGFDGVVQIAHRRALREDISDHGRLRHEIGMNFTLLRIVRADGRDERAGPHVVKPPDRAHAMACMSR
jgi:hypothetical protein